MKSVVVAVAIVALGILVCSWFGAETSKQLMQGELRCEGAGGVVINIGGKDYAVNAMAGPRYPPIERLNRPLSHTWIETAYLTAD